MAGTATYSAPVVHRPRGVVRIEVAVTTDASGDMSVVDIGPAFGRLVGVLYDGGLDASATITLKEKATGATVFTKTTGTEDVPTFERPTRIIAGVAGVAVTAADTAPNVNRDSYVAGKLTLTVAGGGNAETGKVAFIFDESGVAPKAWK